MADRQQIYEAIRRADAAGDRAAVERLGRYLKESEKPAQSKSFWQQAGDSIANVAAGGVEGAAAIPDAVTEAIAGLGRTVINPAARAGSALYRAVGMPGAADRVESNRRMVDQAWSRPATVARGVQRVVPVPKDTAGQVARFGAGMLGGAAIPMGPKVSPPLRMPKAAPKPKVNADMAVVRAGERQKIPVRRPDAIPAMRGDLAAAEASPYAGGRVATTLADDRAALQSRMGEIGGPGNVQTERYNLGMQLQDAGKKFIGDSRDFFKANYGKVDALNRGGKIVPNRAVAQVDQDIAELMSAPNTNAESINYLRGLREDLLAAGDGFTAAEFQALRSANRGKIRGNQALTYTDAERRLGNAVDAFSSDAQAQMTPAANQLLGITDKAYAARMDFINNMLQPNVLGKRNAAMSPEKSAENIMALARNRANYDRMRQFWNIAPENVRQDFRATLTSELGSPKRGEFGLGRLASDIKEIPGNIRSLVYGEQAPDLNDLKLLARAKSDTGSGLNNSRSGVVMARNIASRVSPAIAAGGVFGGVPGAVLAPLATEGLAFAAQNRAANRLLNPDWAASLNPAQAAPSLGDVTAPYLLQGASLRAANDADLLGGLLGSRAMPSLAAEDERKRKKKK